MPQEGRSDLPAISRSARINRINIPRNPSHARNSSALLADRSNFSRADTIRSNEPIEIGNRRTTPSWRNNLSTTATTAATHPLGSREGGELIERILSSSGFAIAIRTQRGAEYHLVGSWRGVAAPNEYTKKPSLRGGGHLFRIV